MAQTPHNQGEGDYESARKFDRDERAFIKKGEVEQKAREAEQALDGPEGAELERARVDSAKGDPKHAGADRSSGGKR